MTLLLNFGGCSIFGLSYKNPVKEIPSHHRMNRYEATEQSKKDSIELTKLKDELQSQKTEHLGFFFKTNGYNKKNSKQENGCWWFGVLVEVHDDDYCCVFLFWGGTAKFSFKEIEKQTKSKQTSKRNPFGVVFFSYLKKKKTKNRTSNNFFVAHPWATSARG